MPLNNRDRQLLNIKDEIIFELLGRGLSYDEVAHIFAMTKQGVWKASKRYKATVFPESS